ncbi:TPA: 30S ribosomal protein S24e [Candidatus Bathyarchaeota archaeon]|nr:30S ribosomal protein S24e [Candidatus Bathyarchaeota archaeon]
MKIEIISKRRNPLLKRDEVTFQIVHLNSGAPPRIKVREALANKLNVDVERVYIKNLTTKTGTMITVGEANIYESVEEAIKIEPKHIILRNTPKEKSEGGE